jgi:hypothetical protein
VRDETFVRSFSLVTVGKPQKGAYDNNQSMPAYQVKHHRFAHGLPTWPLQILRRPRHNSSRISIDRLQNLSQPPMAVVLLIPLIFVVDDPLARSLPILPRRFLKTQCNKVVDVESLGRQPRGPGSFHLEDDRGWSVGFWRGLRG